MIVALDPGLDVTGWSAFREPSRVVLTNYQAAPLYVASGSIRTTPRARASALRGSGTVDVPFEARLESIWRECGELLERLQFEHGPTVMRVFIERPAFGRVYERHRSGSTGLEDGSTVLGSLAGMHVATGVLFAAALEQTATVTFIAPVKMRKAKPNQRDPRADAVYTALPQLAPKGWPTMHQGVRLTNADQRDAILLGFSIVTDNRRRWSEAVPA